MINATFTSGSGRKVVTALLGRIKRVEKNATDRPVPSLAFYSDFIRNR